MKKLSLFLAMILLPAALFAKVERDKDMNESLSDATLTISKIVTMTDYTEITAPSASTLQAQETQQSKSAVSKKKFFPKKDPVTVKYGITDEKEKEITPCKYDDLSVSFTIGKKGNMLPQGVSFSEDLASVLLADKYGFVNQSGIEVIPCKYDQVNDFSEGLSQVRLAGKWGWIDPAGREVIPCIYDRIIEDFRKGKVKVILKGKTKTIKKP
jgi:hypothetical protein